MLHESVLLNESVTGLAIKQNGIYIDGTFGRGGHSKAILQHLGTEGRLIVVDKDLTAIECAKALFSTDDRVRIFHGSFAELKQLCNDAELTGKIDGILLDLGVSSPQLDDPERGFSFMQAGPLDMRMDRTQKMSAGLFVSQASLEDMITVFRDYGEERFARRIANAIISARLIKPITTTLELAEIVKKANPKWEKHKHPATRVFQAIRIFINQELQDLSQILADSLTLLAKNGRLSVISFHSLEDRIVKHFMRDKEQGEQLPSYLPIPASEHVKTFTRIGKAITANEEELKHNVRARSAVLRIGEKLA